MSCEHTSLPHEGIKTLIPYQPGKSVQQIQQEFGLSDVIKLASNENPLGCSPLVRAALADLSAEQIAAYPAPEFHPLRQQLADYLQVDV